MWCEWCRKNDSAKCIIGGISSRGGRRFAITLLRLEGSELTAELFKEGNKINRTINVNDNVVEADCQDVNVEVVWIDFALHSIHLSSMFSDITHFDEELATVEPREANTKELEMLSYIVGKEYVHSKTYELDFADYGEIPYFEVESNGVHYNSKTMGLGELSVHYVLWHLQRITRNSIILIEEPETYLAPRSQEALINVLAKLSIEKNIWIVLTTHSPNILKKIPLQHIRFLARVGQEVRIITPQAHTKYLSALGLEESKIGYIFVEDRAAREFTKIWMGHYVPQMLQDFEVIDVDSNNKIVSALKEFPRVDRSIKIFGLFDGDQRNKITGTFNWPYVFLPSEHPPEVLLKKPVYNFIDKLAELLNRNSDDVYLALSSLEGKDHHDWFIELHTILSVSYEKLMSSLFEVALLDMEVSKLFEDAVSEIQEKLGGFII